MSNPCCGGNGFHSEGTGDDFCNECGARFTAFSESTEPGPCISVKTLAAKRIEALRDSVQLRARIAELEKAGEKP